MRPEVMVLVPRLRAPLEVMAPEVIAPEATFKLAAVIMPPAEIEATFPPVPVLDLNIQPLLAALFIVK